MGTGGIPGARSHWAGAVLVALAVLGTHMAHCTELPEHFLYQDKHECLYTNSTQRVRYANRYVWNQQDYVHFDSDLGVFMADTELGEPTAKCWNSQKQELEYRRGSVDRYCRRNYGVFERGHVISRSGQKTRRVSLVSEKTSLLLLARGKSLHSGGNRNLIQMSRDAGVLCLKIPDSVIKKPKSSFFHD
ncbi:DLA class II histocompatibility antigen, DR-1 beta chain-like [Alligator sinensis]|uniref:DLA class II histocompatibility antigen, DR-1 beta chain-like n=1 Tax=Alligator sinensis TaxID=38654 RepID=A0A1U7SNY4_ALLSI|nr:DLA class II histocompatibility antigen, DR-1 beta chain-like [Alligator sinensis]